jgi:hypothetical protein
VIADGELADESSQCGGTIPIASPDPRELYHDNKRTRLGPEVA